MLCLLLAPTLFLCLPFLQKKDEPRAEGMGRSDLGGVHYGQRRPPRELGEIVEVRAMRHAQPRPGVLFATKYGVETRRILVTCLLGIVGQEVMSTACVSLAGGADGRDPPPSSTWVCRKFGRYRCPLCDPGAPFLNLVWGLRGRFIALPEGQLLPTGRYVRFSFSDICILSLYVLYAVCVCTFCGVVCIVFVFDTVSPVLGGARMPRV